MLICAIEHLDGVAIGYRDYPAIQHLDVVGLKYERPVRRGKAIQWQAGLDAIWFLPEHLPVKI